MKKTLFVAAATAMFLAAFSTSAMADIVTAVNHSGQQRLGAAETTDASSPTSDTIVGGGTYTYQNWSTLGSNSTNGNSPHGNYTTTTVKCVVCHAIHYAAPGGAPVNGSQTADTLLRMKATEACVFCHATTGSAVNGRPVYNGAGASILATNGGGTNVGHVTGTACSYCHTTVHGSNADESVASLKGYLLKQMTVEDVQGGGDTHNMLEAVTNINNQAVTQGFEDGAALNGTVGTYETVSSATLREQVVGVFCAECHLGAYATAAAGASTNVNNSSAGAYSGHRIAASATTTWNVDVKQSSAATTGTIAWAPATNCKSCHDATDNFGRPAFPHAWGNTKMWLTSAEYANAPKSSVGTAPANLYDTTRVQLSDGICLKCHRESDSVGVGLTF